MTNDKERRMREEGRLHRPGRIGNHPGCTWNWFLNFWEEITEDQVIAYVSATKAHFAYRELLNTDCDTHQTAAFHDKCNALVSRYYQMFYCASYAAYQRKGRIS